MSDDIQIVKAYERPDLIPVAADFLWNEWVEVNEKVFDLHSAQDFIDSWNIKSGKHQEGKSFEVLFLAVIECVALSIFHFSMKIYLCLLIFKSGCSQA